MSAQSHPQTPGAGAGNPGHSSAFGATVPPRAELDPQLAGARVSYGRGELLEDELAPDPLAQFRRWYDDARAGGITEPNAMTLATVDAAGDPTARTVLLKDAGPAGFTFFTNRSSRKGQELAAHPAAALVLPWIPLQRQVLARGSVEVLSDAASFEYFQQRPWGSRIGAWASHQSQPVAGRAAMQERWAALAQQYPDHGRPDDVPLPPFWGGYLVRPREVEFWQGRPSRMHDRLVFVAVRPDPPMDDASGWRVERREP